MSLRVFDLTTKAQPLIVEIGVGVLSPLIFAVLMLLWLFEAILPSKWLGPFESLHLWLVKLITRSWGDLWLYVERPWQASRIRVRFEDQFVAAMERLDDDVDTVAIVAHSMGSVIAYEALTGPRLRPLLDAKFGPHADGARFNGRPRLHLITLGSALNIVWTVMGDAEKHRFTKPLPDYVDWLNLWTYLDPYARQHLRIPTEAYQTRPSLVHADIRQPVRESEVVNQQDLFSDHSAYWNNAAQVVSPVLNLLTHGHVTEALQLKVNERLMRVSFLAFFKALAWSIPVTVFAGLFLYVHGFNGHENWPGPGAAGALRDGVNALAGAFPGQTHELVNALVGAAPSFVIDLLPAWMTDGEIDPDEIWDKLFSPYAVAGAFGLAATVAYSTIVKWIWDLRDGRHRYD